MAFKFYTVDRIENNIAVLFDDDDKKSDVPVANLPKGLKEGDILSFDAENNIYIIDKDKTSQVKSNIDDRFKSLFKKK